MPKSDLAKRPAKETYRNRKETYKKRKETYQRSSIIVCQPVPPLRTLKRDSSDL